MSNNPFRYYHFHPDNGKHGGFSACWLEGRDNRLHIGYSFMSAKDRWNRKLGCMIAHGRMLKGLHEGCDIRRGYVVRDPIQGDSDVQAVLKGLIELHVTCPSVAPRMHPGLVQAAYDQMADNHNAKGEAE